MENKLAKHLTDMFLQVDNFDLREFKPCTEEELVEFMKIYYANGTLPEVFQEFLLWGGHYVADMQPCSDFYFCSIIDIKKDLDKGALQENFSDYIKRNLNRDTLIFCGNEGYYYEFINISEGNDPKVYSFTDDPDRNKFNLVNKNFSQRIEVFVNNYLAMHKKRISKNEKLRKQLNEFKKTLIDIVEFGEDLVKKENDETLSRIIRWYKNSRQDVYKLYDSFETYLPKISFYINAEKEIDLTKINPLDKKILYELNYEINKRFQSIRALT
jgi:hypothetical protein